MRLIFSLFLSLFILTGCAFDKEVIHDTQYIVVEPSADLVKDCDDDSVPPDREAYLRATPQEREKLLHDYASSEQAAVSKCNKRWPVLREWIAKQKRLYQK